MPRPSREGPQGFLILRQNQSLARQKRLRSNLERKGPLILGKSQNQKIKGPLFLLLCSCGRAPTVTWPGAARCIPNLERFHFASRLPAWPGPRPDISRHIIQGGGVGVDKGIWGDWWGWWDGVGGVGGSHGGHFIAGPGPRVIDGGGPAWGQDIQIKCVAGP